MPNLNLLCANVPNCHEPGRSNCGGCKLVQYCSKDCQQVHWKSSHKRDCKSPLLKNSWKPEWCVQGRQPAFMASDNDPLMATWGQSKYLLGNMPAFDHIKLEENEGNGFEGDLDVMFAACGDLRNVIVSANATDLITGKLHIVLNDREPYVIVRAILLLIVFSSLPPDEAAEAAVHLWYSPKLPAETMKTLRVIFSEKLDKMRQHLAGKGDDLVSTNIESTGSVGDSCFTVRCVLPRSCWRVLFQVLDSRIAGNTATRIRHRVAQADQRLDYRERHLLTIVPKYRLSKSRYYEDGLVLPYGADRSSFTITNPTLFDAGGNHNWLVADAHDPVNGWNVPLILSRYTGPDNDLYGALYHCLLQEFSQFSQRLQAPSNSDSSEGGRIQFTLLCHDAKDLQSLFQTMAKRAAQQQKPNNTPQKFDRIDVSNLSDLAYIGIGEILLLADSLLKPITTNPHATLHSLFMNYTADNTALRKRTGDADPFMQSAIKQAGELAILKIALQSGQRPPFKKKITSPAEAYPMMFRTMSLVDSLKDFDGIWGEYVDAMRFPDLMRMMDMRIKSVQRPYALKRSGSDERDLAKLDEAELGGLTGHETYVEWVRAR